MLLAVAISPTFTWYLRAMAPRVWPGLTTCFTESAGPFGAAAISGAAVLVAADPEVFTAAAPSVMALPGMMSFWPTRIVASALRLFAAASSALVIWFLWAIIHRLSPFATV